MRKLAREYADAYGTAYRWLYRVCPPWRWLLTAGIMPGSRLYATLTDVRRQVVAQ